jgi:hypothetical protein
MEERGGMRGLHASLLFLQGVPIFIGAFLAGWIAYYLRAAVVELRAIRDNLEWLNDRFEDPPNDAPKDKTGA